MSEVQQPLVGQGEVEYREVANFPDYRVGTDGSVWSRLRSTKSTNTDGDWHKVNGTMRKGYLRVVLTRDGKRFIRNVHHLVLEAFGGPRPVGMEGCHFPDRDTTNNSAGNLRWDFPKGNQADRIAHGTDNRGEKSCAAKLKNADISLVLKLIGEGWSQRAIGMFLGVDHSQISRIKTGAHWKSWKPTKDTLVLG